MRFRLSGLYASGDSEPYDDRETGFDAINENPIFAVRTPATGSGRPFPSPAAGAWSSVNGRNGILNSLRSSKEQGQSNFNNPGTMLLGAGADFDLTPGLRVSANANHLWFENTAVLETLRNEGSIPNDIGWDLSVASIWRPKATQNIVLRFSGAALVSGKGFKDLFADQPQTNVHVSLLANAILSF